MKKITLVLMMVLVGSAALMTNTGCSGDGTPTPTDTTDNDDPTPGVIRQGFDLGVDKWRMHIEGTTEGVFAVANNQTYITLQGQDTTSKVQGQRPMYVTIEVDSNAVGTYTQAEGKAAAEITTGTGLYEETWISSGGSVTVNITEYGAVGERIKGTFSGTFKKGTNSTQVKNGFFDVERKPDA